MASDKDQADLVIWAVEPVEDGPVVVSEPVLPAGAEDGTRIERLIRRLNLPPGYWRGAAREVFSTLVPALIMALLMHTFLAQSTIVYGESMQPNFHDQQRLIMEKFSYRLHGPARGDIVVLRDPGNGPIPLIKRVIALSGERVTIANGYVYIDGALLDEPYIAEPTQGSTLSLIVPPLHVFVMGDNRNNSRDSRYFGPIPLETIVGHPIFRYWPLTALGGLR